ncbi:MAG: hypothetical protein VB142_10350 [Burkholderia sp.]
MQILDQHCLKHVHRVSTRYNKLAESYLMFASLACAFWASRKCEHCLAGVVFGLVACHTVVSVGEYTNVAGRAITRAAN